MKTTITRRLAAAFAIAALSMGACRKGETRHTEAGAAEETTKAEPAARDFRQSDFDGKASDRAGGEGQGGWTRDAAEKRKIIRTGSVSLVVETYDDARAAIEALVAAAGGFVDATQVSHSEGRVSSAQIVVRIP